MTHNLQRSIHYNDSRGSLMKLEQDLSEKLNKRINMGHVILYVGIALEFIAILVYLSIESARLDFPGRNELLESWQPIFAYTFFSLALILFLSVYFLLNRLTTKRDQVTTTRAAKDVFNREIRGLVAVLVVFSLTYILRGLWDYMRSPNPTKFKGLMDSLAIGLLSDFAPVMFLEVFHFSNFHKKTKVAEAEDESRPESDDRSEGAYEVLNLPIADRESATSPSSKAKPSSGPFADQGSSLNPDEDSWGSTANLGADEFRFRISAGQAVRHSFSGAHFLQGDSEQPYEPEFGGRTQSQHLDRSSRLTIESDKERNFGLLPFQLY